MSMFKLNKVFWIEILIFRFENNNLEFKYQVLDQISFLNVNMNFQNWNVNFNCKKKNLWLQFSRALMCFHPLGKALLAWGASIGKTNIFLWLKGSNALLQ
jgi:hypothetical protein